MQNKNLLIVLVIVVGIVVSFGSGALSSSIANRGSKSESISITTNPNPLQIGPATFLIEVKDTEGKPVDNATVFFDLNMTTMNMGTQQGNATSQGNGKYAAAGRMSMRGPWRVSTKVTMPDSSVINKNFTFDIP